MAYVQIRALQLKLLTRSRQQRACTSQKSHECLINVSDVSDARPRGGVKAGRDLRARPIQPFGRSRP
jgi:hypothetical protein